MSLLSRIKAGDRALMLRLNRWPAPRWMRVWMIISTRAGDGWVWFAATLAVFMFGGDQRSAALYALGLSVTCAMLLYLTVKRVTHRTRPCDIETHVWCTITPPDQFSFPSGHTQAAFAVAVCLHGFYPQASLPLFILATCIAVSRVVLGMHYLTDVLAGALFGSTIAYAISSLFVEQLGV